MALQEFSQVCKCLQKLLLLCSVLQKFFLWLKLGIDTDIAIVVEHIQSTSMRL